jgi:hypothetical protein
MLACDKSVSRFGFLSYTFHIFFSKILWRYIFITFCYLKFRTICFELGVIRIMLACVQCCRLVIKLNYINRFSLSFINCIGESVTFYSDTCF